MAKRSKKWKLNLRDIAHGLMMAVGGAVLGTVHDMFINGHSLSTLDLNHVKDIAGGAATIYLLKQVFSNSNGQLKSEPKSSDTDHPNFI